MHLPSADFLDYCSLCTRMGNLYKNGRLVQEWEGSTRMGSWYKNRKLVQEWEAGTRIGRMES